jgi:sulfite reductase (ferredoxin)
LILQINKNEPTETFATTYLGQAEAFLNQVKAKREELVKA